MQETVRIEDQLKRAFEGNAWHGPSVREVLSSVTAAQAARRPLAQCHSIWELAAHISTWQRAVRRRLMEKTFFEPPEEENFPSIQDTSESAWRKLLDELQEGQRDLRDAILSLKEEDLDAQVPGKDHNVYVMLHGVIQHDLYHAGQIALLKKA